jgi:hypothetical protein
MMLIYAERQGKSKWYKLLCTGGHDASDDFADGEGATNHAVMSFFRDTVAVGLAKTHVKVTVHS